MNSFSFHRILPQFGHPILSPVSGTRLDLRNGPENRSSADLAASEQDRRHVLVSLLAEVAPHLRRGARFSTAPSDHA
jgi:hypothetical protein